ncbi:Cdc7p-Dbf4p kinase complex regulatory subunit [Microbotryomycetes sp. JL201]|nr:Cdc7p-Dbf4p kinase complex regulatory subunit [Microbotryomycetes sp. JL201]
MTATARTPPLQALAPGVAPSPRPPSRIARVARQPVDRRDTPKLVLPTVPAKFISASAVAANSPTPEGQVTQPQRNATSTNDRKRAAAAEADVTATRLDVASQRTDGKPGKRARLGSDQTRPDRRTNTNASGRTVAQSRTEKHNKLVQESATWRAKYKKAFPSFTFYFDVLDPATEEMLVRAVGRLGARVENFFSKKVTHVVSARTAAHSGKENELSPPSKEPLAGPSRARTQPLRSPATYPLSGQNTKQAADGLEKNPFIDPQDILLRAVDFGLKVWHVEKLQLILSRINSLSPLKADQTNPRSLSLPSLLRDEQLYGTRERDPFVPRADTHYFDSKNFYILVEDSTGEHRPIVTREYERPRRGCDPSWPVLWGGLEGRGAFYHYHGTIKYEPRMPPPIHAATRTAQQQAQPAQPVAKHTLAAARAVAPTAAPSLRRTLSLQVMNKKQDQHSSLGIKPGFIAASGNSQIITSTNLTSMRSGTATRLLPGGHNVGKRVAELNHRTVPSMNRSGLRKSGLPPGKLKRSVSVDAGLSANLPPAREEPKKPGYCENCRVKYDDFKDHVMSNRHRRFALDPSNWVELDDLLQELQRPLAPIPASEESDGLSHIDYTDAERYDDSGFFETGHDDEDK